MSRAGLNALERELGAPPPNGLAQLHPDQLDDLAAAIAEARRSQAAELAAAGDQALQHLPKLLRLAVRKVLS